MKKSLVCRIKFVPQLENLLFIIFIGLILTVLYQIIARYINFIPRALWSEEVSRSIFIGLVLLSAVLGCYEKKHFKFEYFYAKIPQKNIHYTLLLMFFFNMIVTFFLVKSAWTFFVFGLGKKSLVTGLSYGWPYSVLLIGFGLMLLCYSVFFINALVKLIKEKRGSI